MPYFALISLILFGLIIPTGFVLSLIAGIQPVPRYDMRRLLPTPPHSMRWIVRGLGAAAGA